MATPTADELAGILQRHRSQLADALTELAPSAGSRYETTPPDELRLRMEQVVDACTLAIDQRNPRLLGVFMGAAARQRMREGYSLESLITMAMLAEGALSDLVEIEFDTRPGEKQEARALIRSLIEGAEEALADLSRETLEAGRESESQ